MRYFDTGNRLAMDECAVVSRDLENDSINEYWLTNYYANGCSRDRANVTSFMTSQQNLRSVEGYGIQRCDVDKDSGLRIGDLGRERSKLQLNTRTFRAVPYLDRGASAPCVESRLQQGESTQFSQHRACDKYAEQPFARFTPLQNPCWHIPPHQMPFPQSSTDIMRRHDTVCNSGIRPGAPQTARMGRRT